MVRLLEAAAGAVAPIFYQVRLFLWPLMAILRYLMVSNAIQMRRSIVVGVQAPIVVIQLPCVRIASKVLLGMIKAKCTDRETFVLVVSIDNLDRCPHRQIVQVLEAAHQVLEAAHLFLQQNAVRNIKAEKGKVCLCRIVLRNVGSRNGSRGTSR